jgi:pyruvate formate lyase activating enzyme
MQGMTGLDFPGLVSAVVFTQGCNFHCPYCHNAHLIPRRKMAPEGMSVEEALAFLRRRAKVLDGVVISGGEPTLQPDLAGFCRSAKALGYKVKLDTNGSRPGVIRQLLDAGLLDYVAVDCKALPERYYPDLCAEQDAASALRRTLALLCASSLPYEVRTTCVGPFIGAREIGGLAAFLGDAPWLLQKANLTPVMREKGLSLLDFADMKHLAELAEAEGAQVSIR